MNIIWDPAKAKANLRKHGVHFSDAETAFFDPLALTIEEQDADEEQRFVTLGSDALSQPTPTERKHYEKGI